MSNNQKVAVVKGGAMGIGEGISKCLTFHVKINFRYKKEWGLYNAMMNQKPPLFLL